MSKMNLNPYDVLPDLSGQPLSGGYVYLGVANQDPQANPIQVYWDAALTVPAAQPLRTMYGRLWNNGAPALAYSNVNFSVQVLDSKKAQIIYQLFVAQPVDNPVTIAEGGTGATTAAGALANLGVIAAFVQQTYQAFTTQGTATAYTLTPSPPLAVSSTNTRYNVTFHLGSGVAPTLAISGLTAKLLKQYDATGAKVAATVKLGQITDIQDDGVDYVVLDPVNSGGAVASGAAVPVRQTVLSGLRDANGYANFLSAGSGLNYNVSASGTPLIMTFAQGFGLGGAVDAIADTAADALNQGVLPSLNTSYAYATYVNSITVTYGNTKAPPQYGTKYDRQRAQILQFGGANGSTNFPDDFGNTVTAQGGAKVQTTAFVFGTGALGGAGAANALNGTTDYIRSDAAVFGIEGWATRAWVKPTVLPANNTRAVVWSSTKGNIGPNGSDVTLFIDNTAGVIHWKAWISADASTLLATLSGTSTPVANTQYYLELTYDWLAGVYRLYVNGVQEASFTSASRMYGGFTQTTYGGCVNVASQVSLTGYVDKVEFLPYCDHPGGTSYAVPVAAPSITAAGYAQDYYDVNAAQMKAITAPSTVAGTDPAMASVNRLYLGEVDTGGLTVTATRNYAFQRKYIGPKTVFAASTTYNFGHNLGIPPELTRYNLRARVNSQNAYMDNSQAVTGGVYNNSVGATAGRCGTAVVTGSSGLLVNNSIAGSFAPNSATVGEFLILATGDF